MGQTVLITGTSSGFGKLMVRTLLDSGHTVIATMRDIDERNKRTAQELKSWGAKIIEMDVTHDSSVSAAFTKALGYTGNIDVVVNNAGVGVVIGWQEGFDMDNFQALFDVNVFGVQRVSRAILPHFREKKAGTLVNVSSLLGRMTVPFFGPYNASKWAVEALSENYRVELSQHGIDVCVLEPGGFATGFIDKLIRHNDTTREAGYSEIQPTPEFFSESFETALKDNPAQNPQVVADALLQLIETPAGSRPFRTIVDKMGMGDALIEYNQAAEGVAKGIYGAFQMDHLLQLKQS